MSIMSIMRVTAKIADFAKAFKYMHIHLFYRLLFYLFLCLNITCDFKLTLVVCHPLCASMKDEF